MNISELIEKLTATQALYGDLVVFVRDRDGFEEECHEYEFLYPRQTDNPWLKDVTLPPFGILFEV